MPQLSPLSEMSGRWGPVFDGPGPTVGFELLGGGQLVRSQIRDEAHGFVFALDMLPDPERHLGSKGEPDVHARDRAAHVLMLGHLSKA